jgi:PAS domain S-box-containing protein
MPGMDGYEVCRRLKADEKTRSIPIIFISILEDEADKVEAFRQGAVDYITKPFHPDEVLARVRTHLRLRELTERLERKVGERTAELMIANERLQQEIEERRRAEETLQKSEAKHRIVADNTYDWEFWQSPDGQFIYMSPSCRRITGYKEKEFVADADLFHRIVHPEDRNRFDNHFSDCHRRRAPGKLEYRLFRRDGTVRWIDHVCQPVFNGSGDFLGIRGSNRDITERKQAEENVALLNFSLNKVHEAAFLMDEKARFHYVNEESCRVLNYNEKELLGLGVPDIDPDLPQERWPSHLQELKAKRSMVFEGRHKTKNGTIFPVEINANYFEYGGKAYVLALVRDIRERKCEEEERAKLEEQLRQSQKLETVGLLAGGAAHDFNNILTPILGYSEILMAGYSEKDPRYAQLKQIKKAAEHAKDLTHRLLAFSRKQLIELKSVDLGEIVRKVEDMLRRMIRENIQIEVAISPSLSKVRADVSQMEQALINLSINAQDAMPEGGRLTIEVRDVDLDETYTAQHPEITPGAYVMLSLSDTGTGMDEKTMEHIFEPFFTTKEVGKGTGLGLSAVYGIIKQHGGSLAVYSEKDQGSTFKIFLPCLADDETGKERLPRPAEVVGGIETILVAEDNAMVRDIACKMLEDLGYQVLCADNPDLCIELAKAHQGVIDLLLTDVVMPRMNGKELYHLLRRIRPKLKVLFMSGYFSDVIERHTILDKGVPFLQKPFSIRTLSEKIREVLDLQEK